MYSPLGLVIFVAVERTFVHFTKGHGHFISNSGYCILLGINNVYPMASIGMGTQDS